MKEQDVFPHLDTCTTTSKPPTSNPTTAIPSCHTSSNPSPPPTRLPTLSYDLLKETALRKKLRELGIPEWGPKALMMRRHTEYLNLHNANCDSPKPKTKRELLSELDIWERTQGGMAPIAGSGMGSSLGGGAQKKDFDTEAWSRNHDDDFRKLIEQARRNRKVPDDGRVGVTNGVEVGKTENERDQSEKKKQTRTDDVVMDSQESDGSMSDTDDVHRHGNHVVDLTDVDQGESMVEVVKRNLAWSSGKNSRNSPKKPMFASTSGDEPEGSMAQ
jgi:E3 ubiquitin-protein ligase RAD18